MSQRKSSLTVWLAWIVIGVPLFYVLSIPPLVLYARGVTPSRGLANRAMNLYIKPYELAYRHASPTLQTFLLQYAELLSGPKK